MSHAFPHFFGGCATGNPIILITVKADISMRRKSRGDQRSQQALKRRDGHYVASAQVSPMLLEPMMDLPYFTRPKAFGSTVPISVPLITNVVHQPSTGPFADFPRQLGFKFRADSTECLDIDPHSAHKVTALLQSWLFFGLLAEFLNTHVNVQAFISASNEADGQSLDFNVLENLLVEWNDRMKSVNVAVLLRRKEHILKCLDVAAFHSEYFDHTTLDLTSSEFPSISLSVKLLILLLRSVMQSTFPGNSHTPFAQCKHDRRVAQSQPRSSGQRPNKWTSVSYDSNMSKVSLPLPPGIQLESASPAAKLLIDRMLHAGWCSHVIRKLCRSYDYMTMNYLSLIHRGSDRSLDHNPCRQAAQCIANNVAVEGNASYTTRHTDPQCRCSFLKVDTEQLVSMIRKGEIPLVLITQGMTGPRLALVRRTPRTRYTTFSHVWADGLGNPFANALPQCQIQQLWGLVRSIRAEESTFGILGTWGPTRSPFWPYQELIWIDTLCIPVGSAEDEEMQQVKSKAINHMAPIYAEAAAVFVLDAELQRICVYHGTRDLAEDEIGVTEVSALLLCSTWMGRTWTLQEALVSRHCRYVLANCTYLPGERWEIQNRLHKEFWTTRLRLYVNGLFGQSRYTPDSYKVVPMFPWHDPRSDSRQQELVSPLSWARGEFDRMLSNHFARALDLDKKALPNTTTSKSTAESPSWRATQFARTWNRLLDRSTTKPEDQHGVFATLLDFNAYQVRSLEVTRRMLAIIRSCDELPLSLLFNPGPRLATVDFPENGWIPSAVIGDRLTTTPVLHQTSRGFVLSYNQSESLYVYTFNSHLITSQTFCLQETQSGQDFFVQLTDSPHCGFQDTNEDITQTIDLGLPPDQEACIIFDRETGTSSPKGILAAGVLLFVSYRDSDNIRVKYLCPLLVRSRESFEILNRDAIVPSTITAERFQSWNEIILEYNAEACGERLIRRPAPIDPTTLSVTSLSILTTLISLGCTAVVVTLVAKKHHHDHQNSRHSFLAMVCSLSIILGSLSFLLGGFVQKTCERACTEAWIATFDEHWRPQTAAAAVRGPGGRYAWLRYLPKVILGSHKDSKVYRDERKWANEQRWEEYEKEKLKSWVNAAAAPFRMIAAVMGRVWGR